MNRDEELVEALIQRLWHWHDATGAPLEIRSYLRQIAIALAPQLAIAARDAGERGFHYGRENGDRTHFADRQVSRARRLGFDRLLAVLQTPTP